ncbi:hypothetical protein CH373_14660 [Leptospira perolatii]|uniref:Tetratricopeptide repeat protein n=1 Tax=Leptospira perolatii TaxID=2023191 RepID=A0A2M9ZK04_9LEPT|nr:hypothetical protein [Leptospira perolatii]PJZ69229.1 hypothetical protein CH360_11960 [Leptospira perolatii]PJZ72389.1 hypothetical protein CH373_14660 [Leptospira perolatii]
MQVISRENDWPEITLSHSDSEVGSPTKKEIPFPKSSPEVVRLKTKILENYRGSVLTHLNPLDCFRSDLFGGFAFLSPRKDWIADEGITEREERLLRLFLEELYEELKNHVFYDKDLFSICSAFLLCEDRLGEYLELLNSFPSNFSDASKGRALLTYLGLLPKKESEASEKRSRVQRLIEKHSLEGLPPEEQIEIYDLVVSGQEPALLGTAYYYFRMQAQGLRNVKVLDSMIVRRLSEFTFKEMELFLKDFETRHSIWNRYNLIKKVRRPSQVKEWLREEKKKNGREELSSTLKESILEKGDESLFERYQLYSKQGLVHTLRPFELLTLWNSTEATKLDTDLIEIEKKVPESYLTQRMIAVKEFRDQRFSAFLERLPKTGRFQYTPEMVYLRAVSLLELGNATEGVRLLKSLVYKFPDSDFLRLVLDRYQKGEV